jgi:hypothetical protein
VLTLDQGQLSADAMTELGLFPMAPTMWGKSWRLRR